MIDHQVLKATLSMQIYIVVGKLSSTGYFSGYLVFLSAASQGVALCKIMFFEYFLANNQAEHPNKTQNTIATA